MLASRRARVECDGDRGEGGDPHREVDVEDPAPRQVIDQEPSEQRADHGRHAEYGAEEPLVAPTVARREDVPDHRHRRDDQPSGAESLERAKGDQLSHVLGDTAEGGTDEEDHDRRLQDDLASVEVTELPVHRAGHGRGQEVRRHDPRQVLDAAQLADDRRQRRRHDRLVERRQEEHEQERAEDQSHTFRFVLRSSRHATHEPTLAAGLYRHPRLTSGRSGADARRREESPAAS